MTNWLAPSSTPRHEDSPTAALAPGADTATPPNRRRLEFRQCVASHDSLLVVLASLLHRYGGQTRVIVRAENPDPPLWLAFDFTDDPTFAELVDRVPAMRAAAEARHQPVPAAPNRPLTPEIHAGRLPLYRAAYFQCDEPISSPAIEAAQFVDDQIELAVVVHCQAGRCDGFIQFQHHFFTPDLIDRMAGHLGELLAGSAKSPNVPISELPILTRDETRQMLVDWNATATDFPHGQGIHRLFERQAEAFPRQIAVAAGNQSLSYTDLNTRSNQLAGHLRTLGVGRGVCVGVCLDRSVRMLEGLLGVLKAGAAYVPLDPAFPAERLKHMIDDSAAPIILTLTKLLPRLPEHRARIICLDELDKAIGNHDPSNLTEPISDDELAYVIYTSGSTGMPKGVEVTHGGLVNYITGINNVLAIDHNAVFLAVTTLSFDICGFDIFSPLCVGGKVLLVDRETADDGFQLREFLERCDATVLQATPATWRLLLQAGWKGKAGTAGSIKAISGGEALPRSLADQLLPYAGELWNLYGPTETTIYSTFHRVLPGTDPVPIGRPLQNTTLYILDRHRQPVPIGVAGELYIGGAGVARGYRNRPDLTAERFLSDPFTATPQARLYRTGDITRYRDDGVVEFLGRGDHQVKIRGFRIELEEIEATLLKTPGVAAAVVVAQENKTGSQRLVAFVASAPGLGVSATGLRQALRAALPEYMIPARLIVLTDLPKTLNGKIDRKALPLPAWGQSGENAHVTPSTQVERDLADIFSRVLGAPRVGTADNFFELGGDSLSAVSLAILVKQKFGKTISLAALFDAPTVGQLASIVAAVRPQSAAGLMTLRHGGNNTPMVCLPGSGGFSLGFCAMVELLPDDRPVYAYNLLPLAHRAVPLKTIKDYAVDALRQIRQAIPNGPFHLLGYSFGGLVALEIAQLLLKDGRSPAMLGLIDSWAPGYPSKLSFWPRMRLHARNVMLGTAGRQDLYLRYRLNNLGRRIMRKLRLGVRITGMNWLGESPAQRAMDEIVEAAEWALAEHVPKRLAHAVDLFRVTSHPTDWPGCSFDDPYNGWRQFLDGDLRLIPLPFGHHEVFDEASIAAVAAAVIPVLNEADARLNRAGLESGAARADSVTPVPG